MKRIAPKGFGRPRGYRQASERRQAAQAEHPETFKKFEKITSKAEILTETPRYTEGEYLRDLYRLVVNDGRSIGEFSSWVIECSVGADCKQGTNPWVPLIKATSYFDIKKASKLARVLANAAKSNWSVKKFAKSLELPNRESTAYPGIGRRLARTT